MKATHEIGSSVIACVLRRGFPQLSRPFWERQGCSAAGRLYTRAKRAAAGARELVRSTGFTCGEAAIFSTFACSPFADGATSALLARRAARGSLHELAAGCAAATASTPAEVGWSSGRCPEAGGRSWRAAAGACAAAAAPAACRHGLQGVLGRGARHPALLHHRDLRAADPRCGAGALSHLLPAHAHPRIQGLPPRMRRAHRAQTPSGSLMAVCSHIARCTLTSNSPPPPDTQEFNREAAKLVSAIPIFPPGSVVAYALAWVYAASCTAQPQPGTQSQRPTRSSITAARAQTALAPPSPR